MWRNHFFLIRNLFSGPVRTPSCSSCSSCSREIRLVRTGPAFRRTPSSIFTSCGFASVERGVAAGFQPHQSRKHAAGRGSSVVFRCRIPARAQRPCFRKSAAGKKCLISFPLWSVNLCLFSFIPVRHMNAASASKHRPVAEHQVRGRTLSSGRSSIVERRVNRWLDRRKKIWIILIWSSSNPNKTIQNFKL